VAGPAVELGAAPDLPPGTAMTGYLAGVEGKVLLVVAQELVDALAGTPFGAVEPAQALRPALETLAAGLGGRLDGAPTPTPVEDCLDVLTGGTTVLVPLLAGGVLHAVVGVSLVVPTTTPTPAAAANAASAARSWGIDMLRDVEMEVTCELGRTRMTVRQLLALAPGDVVELDRLAGSPADLLVNGTLLARGEVVVVDEAFGLRITEIVTRDDR
jgi:flagellar motor switch protein FliN/FliY